MVLEEAVPLLDHVEGGAGLEEEGEAAEVGENQVGDADGFDRELETLHGR